MLGSKFLRSSHAHALLSRNLKNFGESVRGRHVLVVPARYKAPVGEKAVFVAVLTLSMFFVPSWILYHIPDYQKENRNEYTGY